MTRVATQLALCPPADGATNFARDDVLRDHARARGAELIRLYAWDRPVLSFGRNERAAGRFDAERLRAAGLDVVRRPTGGRALVHHRELTYAVAAPASPHDSLRAAYDRVARWLADALRRMGVAADVAGPALTAPAAPAPDGAPCFAAPSPGEIVVGGRKLVASAQWRDAGTYLQHGSILVDNDQPLLALGLAEGQTLPPVPPPATMRALLGRAPTLDELADAVSAAIEAATGVAPLRVLAESVVPDALVRARAAHYRDATWTWRR